MNETFKSILLTTGLLIRDIVLIGFSYLVEGIHYLKNLPPNEKRMYRNIIITIMIVCGLVWFVSAMTPEPESKITKVVTLKLHYVGGHVNTQSFCLSEDVESFYVQGGSYGEYKLYYRLKNGRRTLLLSAVVLAEVKYPDPTLNCDKYNVDVKKQG